MLKDLDFIERAKSEGFAEEPKKVNPYTIPHGALHECCLCDVTYRQGIDGVRCPHVKDDQVQKS